MLDWRHITDIEREEEGGRDSIHGLIYLIIPDDDQEWTDPARVTGAIQSVVGLYEVFANLLKRPENTVGIGALDSGSDKSIVLIGLSDVAAAVRGCITDIWDRVLLGRSVRASADLDLIAQSIPIISQIEQAKSAGSVSPEQAELLKRKAISCVTGVTDVGVISRNLEVIPASSPRALVQQRHLMLSGPTGDSESMTSSKHEESARINELEAEVKRLQGEQNLKAGSTDS